MKNHMTVIRKLTGHEMRPLAMVACTSNDTPGWVGQTPVFQSDMGPYAFFHRATFVKQALSAKPSEN